MTPPPSTEHYDVGTRTMHAKFLKTASASTLALVSMCSWAQTSPDPNAYPYAPHMMWGGAYGMLLGPVFMVLLLVALIGGVALVARWGGPARRDEPPSRHPAQGRDPLDILKERFARGEIDREEFEERRRVLND